MQQLTLDSSRRIEWRDVPEPTLEGDGEALVRPLAVSRCDIDLLYAAGILPPPRAFALGHECVGEIVALGDAVRGLSLGQRVVVPFQISCGACGRCLRGHTGSCERVPFLSAYGLPLSEREWGGALSDRIRVPFAEAMLLPAPQGVPDFVLAASADNATDGWRCVAPHLRARPGARVLVLAGIAPSIALYATDAALALGAGSVDFVSSDDDALAIAEALGAKTTQAPVASVRGAFEICIDATGDPAGLVAAVRATDKEGVCVSPVYYPGDATPLPMGRLYTKGIVLHSGRCHARRELPEVLRAIDAGRLHLDRIVTRRERFSDAAEAMAEPAVKLVIEREPARAA
ncbi:MAG TPA: alcohol dehydrogenase catalytic domain-containing protein [Myxococcota bacterium]|nr:alcohol dehydrogenase catalytic domain-containing protein [Myxococcota bacterium]